MAVSCGSSPVSCCSASLQPPLCIRTHPIPGILSRFCRRRRWSLLSCTASQRPIGGPGDRSDTVFGRSYTASIASSAAVGFKTAFPRLRTALITRQNTTFQTNNSTGSSAAAAAPSDSAIGSGTEDLSDTILMVEEKDDGIAAAAARVPYNWEDEWYPLYLTREVPRDGPLAVQVFDKQLVLHYDGRGILRCYEDRCPHRLAKLSEGQVIDGRLECLYHGWQFEGEGQCVKIPQLPESAKIPATACVRSFAVCDVQGVVWVWMGRDKSKADTAGIPRFDQFDDPNNTHISSIHALPYDHSLLLENLLDPAHIPISHDRTDPVAKRENAQPLRFEVIERTPRGFSAKWGRYNREEMTSLTRFQAPCTVSSEFKIIGKDGSKKQTMGILLCRPTGQGKSMLIFRFGVLNDPPKKQLGGFSPMMIVPEWLVHQVNNAVLEEDMGFLASQNEVLMKEKVPTSKLYLNLRTSDVLVMEYRKWLDKVGHGMPYYFGHRTLSMPSTDAVVEAAPAGLTAAISSSLPSKGANALASVLPFAPNPTNRYFRHVVHCAACRQALRDFLIGQKLSIGLALICGAVSVALRSTPSWLRFCTILGSFLFVLAAYACKFGIDMLTTNTVRRHRR